MKRTLKIVVLIISVVFLVSCSNLANLKSNYISRADLTKREEIILTTVTDQSFEFDFANAAFKEVEVWAEKYEAGELVDASLGRMGTEVRTNGFIIIANKSSNNEDEALTFNIGIGDENAISSYSFFDENSLNLTDMMSVASGLTEDQALDQGEIVLAAISYSDDEFGVQSLSTSFFQDPPNHMEKLEHYNVTYLFKIKFTE